MTVKLSLSDEFYLLCKSDAPLNNYVGSGVDIHGSIYGSIPIHSSPSNHKSALP